MDQKVESLLECEDTTCLYSQILSRVVDDFKQDLGEEMVKRAWRLLACTHSGLYGHELFELLGSVPEERKEALGLFMFSCKAYCREVCCLAVNSPSH